jgi:methyl-accepting chemotaxis protein
MGLGVFYSHRIAGPLHNLNNRMKQIAAGEGSDSSPLRFRQKDQFQELAENFNAMMAKLRGPTV